MLIHNPHTSFCATCGDFIKTQEKLREIYTLQRAAYRDAHPSGDYQGKQP